MKLRRDIGDTQNPVGCMLQRTREGLQSLVPRNRCGPRGKDDHITRLQRLDVRNEMGCKMVVAGQKDWAPGQVLVRVVEASGSLGLHYGAPSMGTKHI